jgi:hypothetical protein
VSRLVRIGVADSGINPHHRHVASVAGGISIRFRDRELETDDDWKDELGHGTAVAATIRAHAPEAELVSIRIFHRRLEAHAEALLYAIEWSARERVDVLNLSVGCTNPKWTSEFRDVCRRAAKSGVRMVAAREAGDVPSLPGQLPGVIGVRVDLDLAPDALRVDDESVYASPWARSMEGLSRESNLHGTSLAVAHVSGILAAQLMENRTPAWAVSL